MQFTHIPYKCQRMLTGETLQTLKMWEKFGNRCLWLIKNLKIHTVEQILWCLSMVELT